MGQSLKRWWEVRYPDPDPTKLAVTANEIHVPAGRPVAMTLKSRDVIHSFWVPALHGKMDLVPGMDAHFAFTAPEPGRHAGQCAEFCGYQHALMRLLVVAEPPEQFAQWLATQRSEASEPQGDDERKGRDAFLAAACPMCHTVQGTEAKGIAGPDLTHVGGRDTIGAGTLHRNVGSLAGWIADPQGVKPGNHMPQVPLPAADLRAVAAWLESLK